MPWTDLACFAAKQHHPIIEQVEQLRQQQAVYPPAAQVLRTFDELPPEQVKVVILGQDPYHQAGQAHGLAFSVSEGTKMPPSLRNIFKEIEADLGQPSQIAGTDLSPWLEQGVLLLNTALTVTDSKPGSHAKLWRDFTDSAIEQLSALRQQQGQPLVFILWGAHAIAKAELISGDHLILQSAHPSPLSARRGFFGCQHFSQANAWLQAQGQTAIHW